MRQCKYINFRKMIQISRDTLGSYPLCVNMKIPTSYHPYMGPGCWNSRILDTINFPCVSINLNWDFHALFSRTQNFVFLSYFLYFKKKLSQKQNLTKKHKLGHLNTIKPSLRKNLFPDQLKFMLAGQKFVLRLI